MMPTNLPKRQAPKTERPVVQWLLDSDPSIRWQVMRDLIRSPAEEVAAERARVATEGAGARLLGLQAADGRWGGAAWNRGWNSTMHVLMLLRDLGLDPASDQARRATELVRDRVTWKGCGPRECDVNAFFDGEVEPCINGQVAAVGAYFGQDVRGLAARLLAEQLPDGGWNCEAANGSTRSSFNTTICVLEALLAYERAVGGSRLTWSPSPRAGVSSRAPPLPPPVDRRSNRARSQGRLRLEAFRVPDMVALRCAKGTRVPAQRGRCLRRTDGRGDRAGRIEA